MTKRNKRRKGSGMILCGLLLLLGALGLTAYNVWDAARAEQESGAVAEVMMEQLPERHWHVDPPFIPEELAEEEQDLTMPTTMVDGYAYIGILTVPAYDLELPVMEESDERRLKKAPCRDSGNYKTNDMVIAGHNYAKHFSRLKWISSGEEILFTTPDGEVYRYEVSYIENVRPEQVDYMYTTNGEWDLTLYTCTTSGQLRCAIRCIRTKAPAA